MRLRFAIAAALTFACGWTFGPMLIDYAKAQVCSGVSGFLTQDGSATIGNIAVFGPDCQHLQDGGAASNAYPLVLNGSGYPLPPFVAGQTASLTMSGGQDSINQGETVAFFDTFGANAQGTLLFSKSGGGAVGTGSIVGTLMTVTAVQFGSFKVGQIVGVLPGTVPLGITIASLGSGVGGTGTYNLSVAGTAAPGSTIRTNDTPTNPTAVINGEFLGVIETAGWYVNAGTPTRTNITSMINFLSDGGNWSQTSWPTSIQLLTTPAGFTTPGNPTVSGDIVNPHQQWVYASNGAALLQFDNAGATITDGYVLNNKTAATSLAQVQMSPSLRLTGQGWTGSASATVDWEIHNQPAGTGGILFFNFQTGGGGYVAQARLTSGGIFNVATGFQIFGAAPSGHVIKGNGTNYIDGQVASSELSDAGAWSAFTPSLACGTATFVVGTARFKTIMSKTTFIELDFTISAIGTCTQPITLTLPVGALTSNNMTEFESANRKQIGACQTAPGSSTMTCIQNAASNFAVNDHVIASGSYENQ